MACHLFHRLMGKLALVAPGGFSLRPALQRARGATIGKNVWISQYVYFDELHAEGIHIGDNVTIGLRTSLICHFYWGPRRSDGGFKNVVIEDDVYVGPHCLILPGVRIRRGAVIKGGTTVIGEVPARALWGPVLAGPLARVTVPLTPGHSYEDFVMGLRPFRKEEK